MPPAGSPFNPPFPLSTWLLFQFGRACDIVQQIFGEVHNDAPPFEKVDVDMNNFVSFEEWQQMLRLHDQVCLSFVLSCSAACRKAT